MSEFTPDQIMADAVAGLEAAGFRPVTPAYRWAAAQRGGENWVVQFPRHGPGEGVCRIETPEMAETLAGMLNRAFGLGAGSNYHARWDELRRRVRAELDQAEMHSDFGPGNYGPQPSDALGRVLEVMGEIESLPAIDPRGSVLAQLLDPAEPATHPGGPGPPRQPGRPGLHGHLPAREGGLSAEFEAGS